MSQPVLHMNLNTRYIIEGEDWLSREYDVVVILPTYNEAENIRSIISEIERLETPRKMGILVIDDSSPDGTSEVVREMQRKYENILLIIRPEKMGLGTAFKDCFKILSAMPNKPRFIITMDADFSHDPKDIPRLLDAASRGYDLVIGSRYTRGGSVEGWPITRIVISRVANKLASLLIKIPVKDFTSGFRCYSIEYVLKVAPKLHSQTYEFQIEILKQAQILKARVNEIPIIFRNRKRGKSKLSAHEIKSFLKYITKLLIETH